MWADRNGFKLNNCEVSVPMCLNFLYAKKADSISQVSLKGKIRPQVTVTM